MITSKEVKKITFETKEEHYKEAIRYYHNAKEKLKEARVEYNRYQDLKPVREACGLCYLAVLLTLDGYFRECGLDRENLPTSIDGYYENIKKYLIHNGKIRNAFFNVYEILHIWGYYRGISDPKVVKLGFNYSKLIIETLSKEKI